MLLSSVDFFSKLNFKKSISFCLDPDQDPLTVGPDLLSVLIWAQSVCKAYQQITKVAASYSKERVKQEY